jgi:hypothetical protein
LRPATNVMIDPRANQNEARGKETRRGDRIGRNPAVIDK